jgi:serine/threonine protein kinase
LKQPVLFGKYLLLERINVGGMAEVYLARSRGVEGFKRTLAIKKILPTMAEDDEFIAMFIDEARIAAELSHAGIVQIHELGKYGDDYYITMEFVHGKDLRFIQERLHRDHKQFEVPLASLITLRICESLDYAHTKKDLSGKPLGIIHRDISPQNVLISYEGEVKICDFGIAKAATSSQKTQAGVLKGKFGYMSPEQARGLPLNCRSDIFTVGTLLYEMLTQERLFLGESDFSTLEKVRNADVLPPSNFNKQIPADLEKVILKALAKQADDRFQSASEFSDAIQSIMIRMQWPLFSRDLAAFMRTTFAEERELELKRLEEYHELPDPPAQEEKLTSSGGDLITEDILTAQVHLTADAKTLIFASTEPQQVNAPPPLPSSSKQKSPQAAGARAAKLPPAAISDAKTMIFSQSDETPNIVDAKTMLFTEPKSADDDLSEEPTSRGYSKLKPKAVTPKPVKAAREKAVREKLGFSKEKFFIPVAAAGTVALLWAVFATIRLADPTPPLPSSIIEVSTTPPSGIKLYLDGKLVSTLSPFTSQALQPGKHRLRIDRSDYQSIERVINLAPGGRFAGEFVLKKEDYDILDIKSPVKQEVKPKEGEGPDLQASTPPKPAAAPPKPVAAPPKPVVAPPKPVQASPPTAPTPPAPKPARVPESPLKEEYGYFLASSVPWAKVYVDGQNTGLTTPIPPEKKLKLKAGKHKVTFEAPSGKKFDFDVLIESNKDTKLIRLKLE